MTRERRGNCNATGWAGIRTIIVPPDIVAVQRRSPLPIKKRTPWQPRADCGVITERTGGREWFSDHLFVEAQEGHGRTGYGTSIAIHALCIGLLLVVLVWRAPTLPVKVGQPLVMPATLSILSVTAGRSSPSRAIERAAPNPTPRPPASPPITGLDVSPVAPAPLESSAGIKPEPDVGRSDDDVEGGVAGGVAGSVGGGNVGGHLDGLSSGPASLGPLRVDGSGGSIKPPRKIKDVRPAYPQDVLSDRAQGTVIIEATIGIDGRVHEAKIVHSIPLLDQAALDAVRQWEYTPSSLNGVSVAIIMTVVVKFAIQ